MTVIIQDTEVRCTRSDNTVTSICFYKVHYRQFTYIYIYLSLMNEQSLTHTKLFEELIWLWSVKCIDMNKESKTVCWGMVVHDGKLNFYYIYNA